MNLFSSIVPAIFLAASFASAQEPFPKIPLSALKFYTVEVKEVQLETSLIDRFFLFGHNTIQMDLIDDHYSSPKNDSASASFRLEHGPRYAVDLFCFPKTAFAYPIDDNTLNSYLEGLSLEYKPEKKFEIVEASVFSGSGRSKFRIMGIRAHFITYQYVDAEETKHVSEAWAQYEDHIYVVRIESPKQIHSKYIKELRRPFASMAKKD